MSCTPSASIRCIALRIRLPSVTASNLRRFSTRAGTRTPSSLLRKSSLSFRDAMEKGLFVVINLSKGRLGENSAVLGSLLFTKLQLDIMARARVPEPERRLFAVYADELQNLAGQNFSALIAEAR